VYSLSVEDIRNVVEQEGLRELSDTEIREIEDILGDEIDWYESILSAIRRAVPEISDNQE
jgi:predicted RNA-binding protein with EMAP domain